MPARQRKSKISMTEGYPGWAQQIRQQAQATINPVAFLKSQVISCLALVFPVSRTVRQMHEKPTSMSIIARQPQSATLISRRYRELLRRSDGIFSSVFACSRLSDRQTPVFGFISGRIQQAADRLVSCLLVRLPTF